MDETIEVTGTEVTFEASLKDQVIVTVLGALASMVAAKLTERGYYGAKARYLTRNSNTSTK